MNLRIVLSCCVIAAFVMSAPVYAAGSVVVEYFGQNSCSKDLETQLRLHEFIRTGQDVILINCRTTDHAMIDYTRSEKEREQDLEKIKQSTLEKEGVHAYYNDFCTKRAEDYSLENGKFYREMLLVMVNGRWVANLNDILPAINLGATDNLAKIGMEREGEILHITLPGEITSPKGMKSLLRLFVYMPSTGIEVGKPQDIALKESSRRERIDHKLDDYKRLVPLEEDVQGSQQKRKNGEVETVEEYEKEIAKKQKRIEESKSHFFRPVAAMEKIGVWDGGKAQYDFSLATIASQTGVDVEKMGYVVVLQRGQGGATPIIAAGEIVPPEEQMQKELPKTEMPVEERQE